MNRLTWDSLVLQLHLQSGQTNCESPYGWRSSGIIYRWVIVYTIVGGSIFVYVTQLNPIPSPTHLRAWPPPPAPPANPPTTASSSSSFLVQVSLLLLVQKLKLKYDEFGGLTRGMSDKHRMRCRWCFSYKPRPCHIEMQTISFQFAGAAMKACSEQTSWSESLHPAVFLLFS